MSDVVRPTLGEEFLKNWEVALVSTLFQTPAHRGIFLAALGPDDEMI